MLSSLKQEKVDMCQQQQQHNAASFLNTSSLNPSQYNTTNSNSHVESQQMHLVDDGGVMLKTDSLIALLPVSSTPAKLQTGRTLLSNNGLVTLTAASSLPIQQQQQQSPILTATNGNVANGNRASNSPSSSSSSCSSSSLSSSSSSNAANSSLSPTCASNINTLTINTASVNSATHRKTSANSSNLMMMINNEEKKLPQQQHVQPKVDKQQQQQQTQTQTPTQKQEATTNNAYISIQTDVDGDENMPYVQIPSPTNAQMEELNTKELAQKVSSELKRYSIPQAVFAQRVLCRSQGTLSDLLRNPKPWSKLKSGRETFRRMYKWIQEPESQRMNALRLAGELMHTLMLREFVG